MVDDKEMAELLKKHPELKEMVDQAISAAMLKFATQVLDRVYEKQRVLLNSWLNP